MLVSGRKMENLSVADAPVPPVDQVQDTPRDLKAGAWPGLEMDELTAIEPAPEIDRSARAGQSTGFQQYAGRPGHQRPPDRDLPDSGLWLSGGSGSTRLRVPAVQSPSAPLVGVGHHGPTTPRSCGPPPAIPDPAVALATAPAPEREPARGCGRNARDDDRGGDPPTSPPLHPHAPVDAADSNGLTGRGTFLFMAIPALIGCLVGSRSQGATADLGTGRLRADHRVAGGRHQGVAATRLVPRVAAPGGHVDGHRGGRSTHAGRFAADRGPRSDHDHGQPGRHCTGSGHVGGCRGCRDPGQAQAQTVPGLTAQLSAAVLRATDAVPWAGRTSGSPRSR